MKPRAAILAVLAVTGLALFLTFQLRRSQEHDGRGVRGGKVGIDTLLTPASPASSTASAGATGAEDLLREFVAALAADSARPNEAILAFRNRGGLDAFLDRAGLSRLRLIATIGALHAVRVGFYSLADLQNELLDHAADYAKLDPNLFMQLPAPPPVEERDAAHLIPLGNRLIEFLGVETDTSRWGRGVTIAIIDSGIAGDATFGSGRVNTVDLGLATISGSGDTFGHGTAVAALAAGASPDARGVAPEAAVLSVPVLGPDGLSDTFTVAQGIIAAVDAGAQIINLSLGSHQNTSVLEGAIDYAASQGVVIVAAAGNDQAAQLAWPAADPRVVSVGAVDAVGQQVTFSNSGEQLQITAPGYGVQTAWTDGSRVWLDGTSASAPIVTGAIAAMMSQNPGTTAAQAWTIIQGHSADAGAPGPDPNFGYGVLDLGWAMARDDVTRVDTAVASHDVDAASGEMEVVVQNKSARAMAGMSLQVAVDGATTQHLLPAIQPGGITVISVPFDPAAPPDQINTRLVNPPGTIDSVPGNNQRSTTFTEPTVDP